ncbi:hypothetical protein [Streptomyces sp. DI166]|uniref:hypothetical protein n=1 Tax=Streptomyces sp. DI166 TaxID=1839783 RepID=UPI000B242DEE|nr:hypothetical protein [Streptomyces sp. DI166]
MPHRPRPEEALDFLRAELATGRSEMTEWTTRGAWLAFVSFGRRRFDTAPTPDSDGLLFQYGTYAFSGRPMFTVSLTRQFGVIDDDGEHDHYVQVHCELRYEPAPDLDALGRFDSWFFHDADAELDEWFTAMKGRLALLLGRRPSEIDLYEEPV